jgi:hypothetical protein
MDRRCNWSHIYEIVSWPIPSGFKQEHEGHWIKLSDPENTIIGYLEPYLGKWYEIKKICVNGNPEIYVCGSGHNVSRTYIGDYRPIPPVEEITPISDEEFNSLKPGDRLKLATAEYIDSKCQNGYYQGILHGSNRVCRALKGHYGNDSAKVKYLLTGGRISIEKDYVVHRDFVVGVIKEKKLYPLGECKGLTILNCSEGDFIKLNSQHPSWMKVVDPSRRLVKFSGGGESHVYTDHIKYRMSGYQDFPEGWFFRVKNVWYKFPTEGLGFYWKEVEAISETHPLYGEIATGSPQPNVLQIKEEEKIMLNTVEDIKQLDAKNIAEAAKKVKENRDNNEVRIASERLAQLLDRKESLEASKKDIEKQLNEVNTLVTALGYPPKE